MLAVEKYTENGLRGTRIEKKHIVKWNFTTERSIGTTHADL